MLGMMVGQLLGGNPPLVAAEYQLAILWLLSAVNCSATLTLITLVCRNAVFDLSVHRLTLHKVKKKDKMSTLSALAFHIQRGTCTCCSLFQSKPNTIPTSNDDGFGQSCGYELVSEESMHISKPADMSHIISGKAVYMIEERQCYDPSNDSTVAKYPASSSSSTTTTTTTASIPSAGGSFSLSSDLSTAGHSSSVDHVSKDLLLEINRVNVRSGESLLFQGQGLYLEVRQGDRIVISGPSGLGKTRLLRGISKLDDLSSGYVSMYHGDTLIEHVNANSSVWRALCIYVPQVGSFPDKSLYPFVFSQNSHYYC